MKNILSIEFSFFEQIRFSLLPVPRTATGSKLEKMPKISRFIACSFFAQFFTNEQRKVELIFIPFFLLFNFPIWGVNKHRKLGVSDSKYANELAHCTSVIVEPNLNSNDFNYIFLHHQNIQNDSFIVSLAKSHGFTCIGSLLNFVSCCNFNAKTNI